MEARFVSEYTHELMTRSFPPIFKQLTKMINSELLDRSNGGGDRHAKWLSCKVIVAGLPIHDMKDLIKYLRNLLKEFISTLWLLKSYFALQEMEANSFVMVVADPNTLSDERFLEVVHTKLSNLILLSGDLVATCSRFSRCRRTIAHGAKKVNDDCMQYRTMIRLFDECVFNELRQKMQCLKQYYKNFYEGALNLRPNVDIFTDVYDGDESSL